MTATIVDKSNLLSEPWNNIQSILNNRSLVPDPTSPSASEFRKWIYSRAPDLKKANFSDYPYIICYPATTHIGNQAESGRVSVDGNARMVNWNVEIEIVSCDRGWNNQEGKGQQWLDTVSNSVVSALNNARATLRQNGLMDLGIDATDVVVETEADTLVFRRSILLSARRRFKVQ